MYRSPDRAIYALQGYTVEKRARGWYFAKTHYGKRAEDWRGPYTNPGSVSLVIARELRKEIERRHTRLARAAEQLTHARISTM